MTTTLSNYLKLFRWPNLIIIVISMSFTQFFIIGQCLRTNVLHDGMNLLEFSLLVISTLLIAIGGYIINDIFDMDTDSLNKPGKAIIGSSISVNGAYILYWITTILGVLTGVLLSYLINQVNFGLIFLFSAGLLWFYSHKYQCQPLVGNIVIAILSSISFGLVWLFEFYSLSNNPDVFVNVQTSFALVNRLVIIYIGFAFMVSLLREIVKDIEDYKGDNRFGCITFTVKYGISTSKLLALIIGYISLFTSAFIQYYFYIAKFELLFGIFFIIDLLFIAIIYKLHKASSKTNFTKLSLLIKILMLSGIMSMIFFYFEF